jgi:hypothetical protein
MIRPSCPVLRLVLSALFVVFGASAFVSEGRADIFADIPGIPGASTSPVALGQIVLRSASFGSGRAASAEFGKPPPRIEMHRVVYGSCGQTCPDGSTGNLCCS